MRSRLFTKSVVLRSDQKSIVILTCPMIEMARPRCGGVAGLVHVGGSARKLTFTQPKLAGSIPR